MKALIMADQYVGIEITQWILSEYKQDVALIITTSENDIFDLAKQFDINHLVFQSTNQVDSYIKELGIELDIGFLIWWPRIIKQPLLKIPKYGFINTHPSLLPYNRGKHYNFWALVEQVPFGVSLHFVEEGIDNGDLVSQVPIYYDWEDNGESLYKKAQSAMIDLFKQSYPEIRDLNINRQKQDLNAGSFHFANEINKMSQICLDQTYKARDLLNLLRARTFSTHPACWFEDGLDEYEVRIKITRRLQ
ncbi:MAG: formyltransferase family protein [Pseudanabaena sp.]